MSRRHPTKRAPEPARRATRDRQMHRKWSNLQLSRSRARRRQYPEGMPHIRDTNNEAQARENFAAWLQGVLDDFKARKISKSAVSRMSGVNRNDIDRWLNQESFPRPQTLRRFCDGLDLDYAEPARILGWSPQPEETTGSLEGKIRRAKLILKSKSLTPEQRGKFESMLRGYERAYEGMLDELIEEFERDIDPSRE
jgi:transcriptional regulator with XRE-family HTH domain